MPVISAVSGVARSLAGRRAGRLRASPVLAGAGCAVSVCSIPWYAVGAASAAVVGGCLLGGGSLLWWIGSPAGQRRPRAGPLAVEAAIYAALAAGAPAPQRASGWLLATAALAVLAVREGGSGDAAERVLLIACATPALGASGAFAALLGWGTLMAAADVMLTVRQAGADAAPGDAAPAGGGAAWPASSGKAGSGFGPATADAATARARDLVASRGDGWLAWSAGRWLRGQVPPLPPALVGLMATAVLVLAGGPPLSGSPLSGSPLSGPPALAPVAVLLLAAPGAGHPHGGRWDRLAPPVLRAAEFLYVAGLGFAGAAPPLLTFALVAMVALTRRQTAGEQAEREREALRPPGGRALPAAGPHAAGGPPRPGPGGRLGWEGRILIVGAAAALGVPMFAYVGLTAYLGVALAWRGLSRTMPVRRFFWLAVREGDSK